MSQGFLGYGPYHWGIGILLWFILIVAIVGLYLAIRKRSRHENKND